MKKKLYHLTCFLSAIVLISVQPGCKKENKEVVPETDPTNPFDAIDYGNSPTDIPIDSASFLGLHSFIFSPTCAVPACHDGSFEPDFRTVESAYSTLVLHKPIKNNDTEDFDFRVDPGNSAGSWIMERITTGDQILGRMPLFDQPLSDREINLIRNWIDGGAKDIFGNSPILPNPEPSFFGILAYDTDTTGVRLDTARDNAISAMKLPQNTVVDIWFGLFDNDEQGDFIPAFNFTYNKIKITNQLFNFEGVPEQSLDVLPATMPFMGPIPTSPSPQLAPYYHHFTINTADFSPGTSYYMRVYVQDEDHVNPTELPDDGSQFYLLTYFSFIVQ